MQYRLLLLSLLCVCATGSGASSQTVTPPDQEPTHVVPTLTTRNGLATILNLGRGSVRIVAVVRPSDPGAGELLAELETTLELIPAKRLRAYVFLSRISDVDTHIRALNLASATADRRIVYLWDPEAIAARTFGPASGIGDGPATGVLFLYNPAATFDPMPPAAELWMENDEFVDGPPLDGGALTARAKTLVQTVEREAAGTSASD
jgi:hypothetical protein